MTTALKIASNAFTGRTMSISTDPKNRRGSLFGGCFWSNRRSGASANHSKSRFLNERRIEDRERREDSRVPQQAARFRSDQLNERAAKQPEPAKESERADSGKSSSESGAGSTEAVAPEAEIAIQRRKRARERDEELDRKSGWPRQTSHEHDDDPSPDNHPRRKRDRDFDRGR